MLAPTLLLLAIVLYFVQRFYSRLRRLPPGPTPLPFVPFMQSGGHAIKRLGRNNCICLR